MTVQCSEHLQEALLHLERMRLREEKLRKENDAILDGLAALVGADSQAEVLSILQRTFEKLIPCQACWIMYQRDARLVSDMTDLSFPIGKSFSRVLNGGVVNAFDVSKIPEWRDVASDGIQSALHLPLQLPTAKGMLLLVSAERAAFSRNAVDLAKRVIPFAEQAAARIELINLAHAREMEAQRQLMRLILDHAPVGVWMLDRDGRMKFINRTFCDAVGISESRFLEAAHYAEVLPEQVARQCVDSDRACFEQRRLTTSRENILCADGEEHVFDVIKVPLLGEDGEMNGLVGIAVDVTEQLASAREKEQMEKRLLHAQKLESLGVLAGGIAHDFNNILAIIMGHAEMAESKALYKPSEVKLHLQRIVEASSKAADLCRQMLAYSGRGRFIVEPVNFSDLVHEMVNILEVSLNKGVVLRLSLQDHLPMIEADASQLQQVVMNLVTNANEAIGSKSGMISIRTGVMQVDDAYLKQCIHAEDAEAGRFVFLEVSDTGCGMDKDTMARMFDPFFTTKFTGRGLGMSAILGIVRGHHGALKVDSEPGLGTTFRVLFPALDHDGVPSGEAIEHASSGADRRSTILVVDDEAAVREITVMMLNNLGINDVLVASDGIEALHIYEREGERIDLVLLDLTMPHMDGEETFRRLRAVDPDVKVILSSGYSESDIRERFAGTGIAGFIQKPYGLGSLARVVRQMLDARSNSD